MVALELPHVLHKEEHILINACRFGSNLGIFCILFYFYSATRREGICV